MTFRKLLRADIAANVARPSGSAAQSKIESLLNLRFLSVLLFRIAQAAGRRSGVLGTAVKQINQLITGADLAWQADIGPGFVLRHPVGVVIGKAVRAGSHLVLQQGVTLGGDGIVDQGDDKFPSLGDRVHVGAGARILGGISIGDDAVIGANAVVLADVPANSFAAGVPATSRPRLG